MSVVLTKMFSLTLIEYSSFSLKFWFYEVLLGFVHLHIRLCLVRHLLIFGLLSRAGSWLSFGSRSSRSSTGTSIAGPPPQPSSPPHPPRSRLSGIGMTTWLPSAPHDIARGHAVPILIRFVRDPPRVPAPTHPLVVSPDASRATRRTAARLDPYDDAQNHARHLSFTLTLTRLAGLARNLPAAYVRAVVVGYRTAARAACVEDARKADGEKSVGGGCEKVFGGSYVCTWFPDCHRTITLTGVACLVSTPRPRVDTCVTDSKPTVTILRSSLETRPDLPCSASSH
ncbi:hypothetical protein K438DRAFT_1996974 [Mycena galopus ATCC 62051]|nr:hypothetical protein K438DRAFT_1996974 [Mycena galopus ATCC 62051]